MTWEVMVEQNQHQAALLECWLKTNVLSRARFDYRLLPGSYQQEYADACGKDNVQDKNIYKNFGYLLSLYFLLHSRRAV